MINSTNDTNSLVFSGVVSYREFLDDYINVFNKFKKESLEINIEFGELKIIKEITVWVLS